MKAKFYKCNHCGNVVVKFVDSKVPIVCCGEKMEELVPNVVEASGEKHIPVVTLIGEGRIRVERAQMCPYHNKFIVRVVQ